MCFGKTWSFLSFSVMLIASCVTLMYKADMRITLAVAFLACKELLQLLLYFNIECNTFNNFLTTLSWIHISYQPLFVLILISAFSKHPHLYNIPIVMCLVFAIFNAIRLKELDIFTRSVQPCADHGKANSFCRPNTCSVMGKYHVAYGFQLNTSDNYEAYRPTLFTYFLLSTLVPFLIGDWEIATIHALVMVTTVHFAGHDLGEGAALWCLNTFWIGILAMYVVFKGNPFLRR